MYYGCRLYKWQMDSNPLKTKDGAAVSIANTGSWGAWCRLPTELNAKERHVFQSLFTPTRGQTAPSQEREAAQCAQVEASGDPIMLPWWWNLPGVVCSFAAAQQALLLLQILRHSNRLKMRKKKWYKARCGISAQPESKKWHLIPAALPPFSLQRRQYSTCMQLCLLLGTEWEMFDHFACQQEHLLGGDGGWEGQGCISAAQNLLVFCRGRSRKGSPSSPLLLRRLQSHSFN